MQKNSTTDILQGSEYNSAKISYSKKFSKYLGKLRYWSSFFVKLHRATVKVLEHHLHSFFCKQPVYKQPALGWQTAKQLCWHQQWRYRKTTNWFWKGVSENLVQTCIASSKMFQPIRSRKIFFNPKKVIEKQPTKFTF